MKYLILCLLQGLFITDVFAQNCPPNLDFEKGNLSGWQCSVGFTSNDFDNNNVITLFDTIPITGRHEVISAATSEQTDAYGNFPKLCPYGGNYSVKLGNDQTGNEAEGISYTFRIPADVDTLTFTYFYAVVFEDPQHDHYAQPRFFVTAYDVLTGEVINCASYDYVSTSNLPGFMTSPLNPSVLYKDWSPVSLQFAGLNGRLVRLEFKTADCTLGGHFGYAYLDVGTGCSNILATAPYCIETNSLILNAPYGFKEYTWHNEDYSQVVGRGQSITLSPPPVATGTFYVDMVPYPGFGCRDTASATVLPLPVPPMPLVKPEISLCQFATGQQLTATALKAHELLWYASATGGIPSTTAPTPSTTLIDTLEYYVSQKQLFGCESFRAKITVIIRPTPVTSFTQNSVTQCQKGNEFIFTSTATNLSNSKLYWHFGDGSIDSTNNNTVSHTYTGYGTFDMKLLAVNNPTCSNEKNIAITVMPAPVPEFDYPPVICEKETVVNLSDRSYAPDNMGTINTWRWEVEGVAINTPGVASFVPRFPGNIKIKLSVVTQDGCKSDTLEKILQVHYRPDAAFEYANSLCENEIIKLKDLSTLPSSATGEVINNWTWEYERGAGSAIQHPSEVFAAGIHHVKLIARTNFGCNSLPVEHSITVHPKPHILLHINDSCVYRNIIYRSEDLIGDVQSWYWDFGHGLKKNDPVIKKSYLKEGNYPLTLLGETINGCKDTVIRPFRIYDNKSFAGRDTVVAKDQPIYLNAGGGPNVTYTWTPSDGLSDPGIENPIATLDRDQGYSLYSITDKGCDSRSKIFIKRYKGPDIYIPNAFTPNGDGKNDELKVVPIGIRSFLYLAVYNRFGQQLYHSTDQSKGWNGIHSGKKQDAGTYVAVSKAIDYKGNVLMRKETVILLR